MGLECTRLTECQKVGLVDGVSPVAGVCEEGDVTSCSIEKGIFMTR
jgi:hypothetical protein